MEDVKINLTPETDESIFPKEGPERVGFGLRLGAYLIDFAIVFVLGAVFMNLFPSIIEGLIDYTELNKAAETPYFNIIEMVTQIGVGATIMGLLYNLLEAITGYTLGKLILGLQIAKSNGESASIEIFALRFALKNIGTILGIIAFVPALLFVKNIGSALGFVVFVGCFFVLGEKRLAFHDMLAKTAVFRKADVK